jgi:hypothetical protein
MLSIALFKMKHWSRLACIVVCAVSLIFIPPEVIAAHGLADLVGAGLRTLFFVWVICYLSQPHVRDAFRVASSVRGAGATLRRPTTNDL